MTPLKFVCVCNYVVGNHRAIPVADKYGRPYPCPNCGRDLRMEPDDNGGAA